MLHPDVTSGVNKYQSHKAKVKANCMTFKATYKYKY